MKAYPLQYSSISIEPHQQIFAQLHRMRKENILFFLFIVIFAYCDCRISVSFAPILKCFNILEMA
jgi:hypothetical protein